MNESWDVGRDYRGPVTEVVESIARTSGWVPLADFLRQELDRSVAATLFAGLATLPTSSSAEYSALQVAGASDDCSGSTATSVCRRRCGPPATSQDSTASAWPCSSRFFPNAATARIGPSGSRRHALRRGSGSPRAREPKASRSSACWDSSGRRPRPSAKPARSSTSPAGAACTRSPAFEVWIIPGAVDVSRMGSGRTYVR